MNSSLLIKGSLFSFAISFASVSLSETSEPKLNWKPQTGTVSYTVQFSKDKSFSEISFFQETKSNKIKFRSTLSGDYFWRVLAEEGTLVNELEEIQLVDYFADDDEDGLKNGWEMNGHNGIDLPKLGADYKHKDLFVYMNYMKEDYLPSEEGFERIVKYFADGAIDNPDGKSGVKIHLEQGGKVPFDDDLQPYSQEIRAIKKKHFPSKMEPIYHYMIWAHKYNSGSSSGVSLGIPAHDFIVSLGSWGSRATEAAKIGTFIHELGHNLGFKHGGRDHGNWKPNYISVMNYAFQINGIPMDGEKVHDYQRFDTLVLNEKKLDEAKGIGEEAASKKYGTMYRCKGKRKTVTDVSDGIDWNCDGRISGVVSADIDGSKTTDLKSINNWKTINLTGGLSLNNFNYLSPEIRKEIESDVTLKDQLEIDKVYEAHGYKID